jgi:hypothetical protein
VIALAVCGMAEAPANACENAVQLSADDRIRTLLDAEAALDEGELDRARDLAHHALRRESKESVGFETPEDRLDQRAYRVLALAYVRDPAGHDSAGMEVPLALVQRRQALPNPSSDADYAEALSHVPGGHEGAYDILKPLARKDLIGSPHALGALHRVASERGDEETASYAKVRCEGMIGPSSICWGDYPHPPLIRGTTRSYLPHALLALAALAYRLLRSRRVARGPVLERGRPALAPWVGHAALLQTLTLAGGAAYVLARATSPTWTSLVFAAVLLLTFAVERRAFFAAVRRGRIQGLVLRPSGPHDAHLPSVALFRAPSSSHTLEHEHAAGTQPGYREPARTPLLRLERRHLPKALSFALAGAAVALLALLFLLTLVRFRG